MKLLSWNIARRREAWAEIAQSDADIAIVQEANNPPRELIRKDQIDSASWETIGNGISRPWRTAIVKLSSRVDVEWLEAKSIDQANSGEFAVSQIGTLSAAKVTSANNDPIIVISAYGLWQRPHPITSSKWIMADTSVHRLISDVSSFVGHQNNHRLIMAGDLNILNGYGEHGSEYWGNRYKTIFERMSLIGIPFVGPQYPNGGRQAQPWPKELPLDSKNVPTYYTNRQTPKTATRQLDFVFASESLKSAIEVRALNEPDEWGPSDHCRNEIIVRQ